MKLSDYIGTTIKDNYNRTWFVFDANELYKTFTLCRIESIGN